MKISKEVKIVIDTSAIIAVVANEPHKERIIELTERVDLIAPASLHWEIGNAFSAMFKQNRVSLKKAIKATEQFQQIPVQTVDVKLNKALKLASTLDVYAYDAYMLCAARNHHCAILTLDGGLQEAARQAEIKVMEV